MCVYACPKLWSLIGGICSECADYKGALMSGGAVCQFASTCLNGNSAGGGKTGSQPLDGDDKARR